MSPNLDQSPLSSSQGRDDGLVGHTSFQNAVRFEARHFANIRADIENAFPHHQLANTHDAETTYRVEPGDTLPDFVVRSILLTYTKLARELNSGKPGENSEMKGDEVNQNSAARKISLVLAQAFGWGLPYKDPFGVELERTMIWEDKYRVYEDEQRPQFSTELTSLNTTPITPPTAKKAMEKVTKLITEQLAEYLRVRPKTEKQFGAEVVQSVEFSVNLPVEVTGTKLESIAHLLSRELQQHPSTIKQWSELPKKVRSELLKLNSMVVVILVLRFMNLHNINLIGQTNGKIEGILAAPELKEALGLKYTASYIQSLRDFVYGLYSPTATWNRAGQNGTQEPLLGIPSSEALHSEEFLALCERFDSTSRQKLFSSEGEDYLASAQYERKVRFKIGYSGLLPAVHESSLYADYLRREPQWMATTFGSCWTSKFLRASLDLF